MAWSDQLSNDSETECHFVRASCRIRVLHTEFTQLSGNIYYASFTHGPVTAAIKAATTLSLGSSAASLTNGQYYYDRDAQRLYININFAPQATDFIVATFYLFFANDECLWYQTPNDSTTPIVQWRPLVKVPPAFRVTIPPKGLGFFPIEPSSLMLVNDHSLNYLLGRGSFMRTDCEVWHQLGEREVSNFRKKLTGLFGMRMSISEDSIIMDVVDKSMTFDAHITGRNYDGSAAIDPRFHNTSVMKLIGGSGGFDGTKVVNQGVYGADSAAYFEMVNCGYDAEAPTTGNNRNHALLYDAGGTQYSEVSVAGTLKPGGASTYSCTTPADTEKFREGERVWFDSNAGAGSDQYLTIATITGAPALTFDEVLGGGNNQGGVLRRSIFDVILVKDGVRPYRLKYGRDFTEATHLSNVKGITLTSTAEANVGAATFNPNSDAIWCVPLGRTNQVTYNAGNVGGATCMKSGDELLFQFLKEEAGLSDSEIDYPSISAVAVYLDYQVMVPMPVVQLEDYPMIREALDLILKSLLLRGYFNNEGKFTVRPYRPITTVDETFDKEEISQDTFSYDIDYSEVKKVYQIQAWNSRASHRLGFSGSSKEDIFSGVAQLKFLEDPNPTFSVNAATNNKGQYLHQTEVAEIFEHLVATDNLNSAFYNRVTDLFGERDGLMRISGKRLALERESGDPVTVCRDSLPSLEDAVGNSANFEVLEIEKAVDSTSLTLSDNKAANDASAEVYWSV